MSPSELATYYADLLILQFAGKAKAHATIEMLAAAAIAELIYQAVQDGFNLTTAIGAQLDALGTYEGQTRYLYGFDPGKVYLALNSYDDSVGATASGLADYDTDPIGWNTMTYEDSLVQTGVLNDGDYRRLLEYLARERSGGTSLADIDALLFSFFGTYATVAESANMALTYTHESSDPNALFSAVAYVGKLPRPAGVSVTVVEV